MIRSLLIGSYAAALLSMIFSVSCSDNEPIAVPSSVEMSRKFGNHDRKAFVSPDKVHYPETWFHYIGGNVSHEGITADLEAIASAGLSGIQLFHGQFGGQWPATNEKIECLSENWDSAVKYTADECKRMGLRFTMQNCPGWAMSGGPWIKPENAMRTLVYSRADVAGGDIEITLEKPRPSAEEWRDYRDIAVVAFPRLAGDSGKPLAYTTIKGSGDYKWKELMLNGRTVKFTPTTADNPHWVETRFSTPTVVRSIEFPAVQSLNHNMSYEPGVHINCYVIKADGSKHKVVDADLPQSSWQDNYPITFACEEKGEAVGCRIELTNAYDMNMRGVKVWSTAHKNSWQSEAGWTLRSFERTADDVKQSAEAYIAKNGVVDLSQYMDAEGNLKWSAPKGGEWTILRIGHVNEGKKNSPAPPEGTGWECDKLSTEGPEAHYAGYIGRLTNGVLQGGMLGGLLLDSWECRTQMWTMKMEQEFAERKGYELRNWLPALFGYVIDSPETTSRFLLDWRSVVGDLFANKFYRRMAELGHAEGLTVSYETAAGDIFPVDIMEYFKYADIPMCEFWHPYSTGYVGSLNFKPVKPTASAARLYGKPRVAAESFTSFSLTWDEHLDMLKEYADYHFVEGVTHNVFHTYTHNPQIGFLPPGTSMGSRIGTPFLRGQTWWPYVGQLTTYLARCSYMLERGQSVSDVLWYLGDEISHKPDQEYPFPAGYKYDYCNPDVLLNRLAVKDGDIVTPEGLIYKVLWIPENKRMRPETLERLYTLLEQGATIVANAPVSLATLQGGDDTQQRFDKAVKAIWGSASVGKISNVGAGRLLSGMSIDDALTMLSIKPDVKGNVRWIHRTVKGADWYFVTPEKLSSFNGEVAFLADGAAELWNAVTGEIEPLAVERRGDYSVVTLDMPQAGSCFVVFEHDAKQKSVKTVEYKKQQTIDSEWSVRFPEGWGAPAELKIKDLVAWSDMPISEEGRAFSGSVVYSNKFNLQEVPDNLLLDLGSVNMIAEITINSQVLRPLWCAPYAINIADYVRKGENELQIKVTSTWFNRLVYDASKPESERKTWTINGPSAQSELKKYGLLGPVVLKSE